MAKGKPRKRNERVIHSRWDVTERRWLKRNRMPYGTRLALERVADGRKVRGDTVLHRHVLPLAVPDGTKVAAALEGLQGILITDVAARGWRLRLYRPDGTHAKGNTLVASVRGLEPLATPDEVADAARADEEVDLMTVTAGDYVDTLDAWCAWENAAPRAFVRALLEAHGRQAVESWVDGEASRL